MQRFTTPCICMCVCVFMYVGILRVEVITENLVTHVKTTVTNMHGELYPSVVFCTNWYTRHLCMHACMTTGTARLHHAFIGQSMFCTQVLPKAITTYAVLED